VGATPHEIATHDTARLLVENRRSNFLDVLGTEPAGEGERSARVRHVVDHEQALRAEEREVRHGWEQERLVETLIDSGVELDVQRRHVLHAERVCERAGERQPSAREREHRVRPKRAGLNLTREVAGAWPSEDVPVWELPVDRWRATLDANLTATFLTARGFLRELEGDGTLILVGSTAGIFGEAGHADYAAAKSAVLGGLLLSLKN